MAFRVLVDDNYHYMDDTECYELGSFATLDAAIAACRRIIDDFLHANYTPGMSAVQLYGVYTAFGEDPFIAEATPEQRFSAWEYAKQRAAEICGVDALLPDDS
ncbi:MAG TPA: hypothetical protein PKA05_17995 [Roseiflexaceae bacterium]|nr:hypothetical protein [Roseiflexaceae bacterium]HMP42274.1 hypothetical protein [Roseiflexaceae bacterium]